MAHRLLAILVLLAPLPAAAQSREVAPVFEDGDLSVREVGERIRVQWGEHSLELHHTPGVLQVRRVMLDADTPALYLHGEHYYPLIVLRGGRLERMDTIALSLDARPRRLSFPGDGTARAEDVVHRPCNPRRADLLRTRRRHSLRMTLREINRNAQSWRQARRRDIILERRGNALVHRVPHFRFVGSWGRCEGQGPFQPSGAASYHSARTPGTFTAFTDGVAVFSNADIGLNVQQAGDTLRVEWRDLQAFVGVEPGAWPGADVRAREVEISPGVHGLFLSAEWLMGEDWSTYENFLWIREGETMRRIDDSHSTHFSGSYDETARFPGDGTVRIVRTASRECRPSRESMRRWQQQMMEPGQSVEEAARSADNWVRRRSVERILDIQDGRFVHGSPRWRATSAWGQCDGLVMAACPFVDVVTPGGVERIGEILRSTEYEPALQSLTLPPVDGTLVLRVSEEKAETTFLDEIHVSVDGAAVFPDRCRGTDQPAYCRADGEYFVLQEGDSIELHFTLPGRASGPEVVATGYYEPDLRAAPADRH